MKVATGSMEDWFRDEFGKALQEINMDSSPGLCQFSNLGTTNGEIFGYSNGTFNEERVAMVRAATWYRMQALLRGEAESDDINVFVKQEPHKLSKIAEERYRLISGVSLVDTMIDRVLFGWLNRVVLNNVCATPCFVGWSPIRGGWRYVYERFKGHKVACLDKSSWDWTVQEYLVDMWFDFICGLAAGHREWWLKLARSRFDRLFVDPVYQFKDGTRVQQRYPGIMKSGCLLTLFLNSVGQSLVHYLANIRMGVSPYINQPICVGDDTVQRTPDDLEEYVRSIETTGAKVKGFKVRRWVEFCGFFYAKETCAPAYWQKHLYKLCYGDLSLKLEMYQVLYANEPVMFKLLHDLAVQVDPALAMTSLEAKFIFNTPR